MDANIILRHELIERIIRFEIHLDEIKEQFYYDNKNKQALIENFKIELEDLYRIIDEKQDKNDFHKTFLVVLHLINSLHEEYLKILPRPSEPVELTRFERNIKEQFLSLIKTTSGIPNVSISTNETIGETTKIDYLFEYKDFKKIRLENEEINVSESQETPADNHSPDNIPITISRIDAPNTFRWPSLIHEVCHHILKGLQDNKKDCKVFSGNNILEDFLKKNKIKKEDLNKITPEYEGINFEGWLSECFCDVLACLLIGPSFYFSQFVVFLNSLKYGGSVKKTTISVDHPPHLFRMLLMRVFIKSHRFPTFSELLNETEDYKNVFSECCELLQGLTEDKPFEFYNILNLFIAYFKDLFPKGGTATSFHKELLNVLKKYVVEMQPEVILDLTKRLEQGLPIPSIRTLANNSYKEIPTHIQEIFLASWLAKFSLYKQTNELTKEGIKAKIIRHDQAVLKSIQVSEWFDMLINREDRGDANIKLFKKKKKGKSRKISSVLTHDEIETLIYEEELNIIPLMYNGITILEKERKQIGTTSIDIRLGTSFQIFYPDQYGIIDFTDPENTYSFRNSSKRIDLDFLQSITIAPGQFMLAHSMEYVKLPNYICGNLEGRSSFARLGLEIHMTAGFIDPGFEGVITFEMYNAGPTTIKLYPGMRIGQIRFERNLKLPPSKQYKNRDVKYRGLLEHNVSLQKKDIEVELITKLITEKRQTKSQK